MKIFCSFLGSALCCFGAVLCFSCSPDLDKAQKSCEPAPIFPVYEDGTHIPCNIAPLNFSLPDSVCKAYVRVRSSSAQKSFRTGKKVGFPLNFWKRLTTGAREKQDTIVLELCVRGASGGLTSYPPIRWIVCVDSIDPFLTYRLLPAIEGTYNTLKQGYNVMELRERNLQNFEERILLSNELMQHNCFNCHTSPNSNPYQMLLHLRKPSEGTLFFEGKNVSKRFVPDLKNVWKSLPDSLRMPLNLGYPAWHPQEEWIAFSTNVLGILGYTQEHLYVDILDSACNIVLYNVHTNEIVLDKALWTADFEETWPAWSPDGKWLYFCRTPKLSPDTVALYPEWGERIQHIRFDLCRIAFDAGMGRFSDTVQTLLYAAPGSSYSMPRVQPDGKGVLLCRARFNSIPYHALGDLLYLRLDDFENQENIAEILNSDESESWHDWSGNGRWVVFGSKRQDAHHELLYIAYFDGLNFGKPFLLPQKSGNFYLSNLRLFNLPTFERAASPICPRQGFEGKNSPALEMGVRSALD